MAFQHVIINNSLVTNSSDIYTALGCLSDTDRETIMKETETDTGSDRFLFQLCVYVLRKV